MALIILIGASGAGKTTLAEGFAARYPELAEIVRFDRIGVPSEAEMVAEFGSGEAWQRAMTFRWLEEIAARLAAGRSVLFEGQTRPSFVAEAAAAAGIGDYRLVLVDCDDATRARRLCAARGQSELASSRMMDWAAWLRAEAKRGGHAILDTSAIKVDEAVAAIHALGFGTG